MIMRKFFILAIVALLFAGCSSDDEPNTKENTDKEVAALADMLNGAFFGERYSSVLNYTEHEDITFQPFSEPRENVSYFGTFTAYGVASVIRYVNDHSDTPSYNKTCLYTFGTGTRNERTISFYPCIENWDVTGSEDRRIIVVESASSFKMHHYGETEDNALTYSRK